MENIKVGNRIKINSYFDYDQESGLYSVPDMKQLVGTEQTVNYVDDKIVTAGGWGWPHHCVSLIKNKLK